MDTLLYKIWKIFFFPFFSLSVVVTCQGQWNQGGGGGGGRGELAPPPPPPKFPTPKKCNFFSK